MTFAEILKLLGKRGRRSRIISTKSLNPELIVTACRALAVITSSFPKTHA